MQGLPRQNLAQQLNRTDFLGQVEHLRKFDINNVFVLGTLEALHFVISKYRCVLLIKINYLHENQIFFHKILNYCLITWREG